MTGVLVDNYHQFDEQSEAIRARALRQALKRKQEETERAMDETIALLAGKIHQHDNFKQLYHTLQEDRRHVLDFFECELDKYQKCFVSINKICAQDQQTIDTGMIELAQHRDDILQNRNSFPHLVQDREVVVNRHLLKRFALVAAIGLVVALGIGVIAIGIIGAIQTIAIHHIGLGMMLIGVSGLTALRAYMLAEKMGVELASVRTETKRVFSLPNSFGFFGENAPQSAPEQSVTQSQPAHP